MSDGIRRLDDRLLPGAAQWLRRVVDRGQALLDRLPRPAPSQPEQDSAPQLPIRERLHQLDQRHARTGLLGLIAEVPQVGAVLVALILAINAFTVAARQSSPSNQASPGQPGRVEAGADPVVSLVGIRPGTPVAAYLADAQSRLERLAVTPDASLLALISFDQYVTAAEAAQLAAPTKPTRAFYAPHAKGVAPGTTAYASVVDITVDLPAQLRAAAASLLREAKAQADFAATIPGVNAEERAQKAQQLKDAAQLRAQAVALAPGCACVFAVLVRGPARVLFELSRRPGIRVVDPAPPGAQTGLLDFFPLRPETRVLAPSAGPNSP